MIGQWIAWKPYSGNVTVVGKVEDIKPNGRLVVRRPDNNQLQTLAPAPDEAL